MRPKGTRSPVRGQVGAIVEMHDDTTVLVEFSDDLGRAYAIAPCPRLIACAANDPATILKVKVGSKVVY